MVLSSSEPKRLQSPFLSPYHTPRQLHNLRETRLDPEAHRRDDVLQHKPGRRRMSEGDPIQFRPRHQPDAQLQQGQRALAVVAFNRQELSAILNVYGRKVAAGEWRDYAMDFDAETATFAVYRRASDMPLYRIEKCPKLARKQGAYAVISVSGQILKRGHDLDRVLAIFEKSIQVVS
jgi:Protein of unknown function (DUF2794)